MTLSFFAVEYIVGRPKGGGSQFDCRVHGSIDQVSSVLDEEVVPTCLQMNAPIVMSAPLESSRRFFPRRSISLGAGRLAASEERMCTHLYFFSLERHVDSIDSLLECNHKKFYTVNEHIHRDYITYLSWLSWGLPILCNLEKMPEHRGCMLFLDECGVG